MAKFSDYLFDGLLSESINDKGIFKAVFMAGHPGAGKSYVVSSVRSGSIEPRIVNVDKYLEYFGPGANYDNILFDRSKILTNNQLALYINAILPLAVDGTAATTNSNIRRKALLESFGYDTAMVFVRCSLETAIERVRLRKRQVAVDVIKKYYEDVQNIKPYLKSKFSPFIEVDNNEGELTDNVINKVFSRLEGFYLSPVKNYLGQEAIELMKQNGWKYLSDGIYSMEEIRSKIDTQWYRR
jgi:hypothetical protein